MLRVLFFWQRAGLARQSGQKNKTATPKAWRGFLGNAKRHWIGAANPGQNSLSPLAWRGFLGNAKRHWIGAANPGRNSFKPTQIEILPHPPQVSSFLNKIFTFAHQNRHL
jgi:hypothetical protein